ncbi:MAG: Lin1244/Lin1753 domain-containing protein [Peptoniphilaceae bacterium]
MARPLKSGIDYYPMDVDFFQNIKIRKILRACGANSISILINLLCSIYRDKGYYLEWTDDMCFLIADEIGVKEVLVKEVINKAIQTGFFNKDIFEKYKILTSIGIQKRYLEATERRKDNFIIPEINLVNVNNNLVNVCKSTQSKVKESKVNKSKEKSKENSVSLNKNIAEMAKLYEASGFGTINLSVKYTLVDFNEQYSIEWIREAFKIASDNNKHSLAYVNGILENWKRRGKSNSYPTNNTKKTKFHNFEQLTDKQSEDDLEDLAKKKRKAEFKRLGISN